MSRIVADLREMAAEQIEYRDLLYQMTKRDLLLRYKQTIMGFGWAIFMPLLNTAVFSVIFTRVAPISTPVPYPVFAYCGLFTWNFFASSLRFSVNSLTSNATLVTKVYFPREIFPLSSIVVCLADFAIAALVLVALMIYYAIPPTTYVLLLPVVVAVHVVLTTGVGLLFALGNLYYRDVKYLFEIVITVWMFLTSVLYPIEAVHGRLATAMYLNPMTPIVDGYRDVLLLGRSPFNAPFALASVVAVVLCGVAWLIFHRAEFSFAERI